MVREFGNYLEELVKDYLIIVEGFDVVDVDFPYQLPPNRIRYGKRKVRYPTDIDVVGIRLKGNEIWLIECQEEVAEKDNKKFEKKFKRHAEYSPFSERYDGKYKIEMKIAACHMKEGFPKNKFDVLRVDEMINKIDKEIQNLKDKKHSRLTYGRYAWILKWMRYHKILK